MQDWIFEAKAQHTPSWHNRLAHEESCQFKIHWDGPFLRWPLVATALVFAVASMEPLCAVLYRLGFG